MIKPRKKFEDSNRFNSRPLVISGLFLLLIVLCYFAIKPLRQSLSEKYLTEGSRHLAQAEYIDALVDFRKSDFLVPGSAAKSIDDCNQMQLNVSSGEMYFRRHGNVELLSALKEAESIPESESEGMLMIKNILEKNQPQIAEIAAEILIEMDSKSAKAWSFLGISRLQSARLVQMTESNRNTKLVAAREAFSKALALDAADELSKRYLNEVDKLL